ncbi:MAG: glycosyltransferase family 4 protein [Desulfuromonadales bacterium]
MKICYLLESTDLNGGVRVVFDQARALAARGHQVQLRALRGSHDWYPFPLTVSYGADLAEAFAPGDEPAVVVATYWTTVAAALTAGCGQAVHFCQGHEADFIEFEASREAIAGAYRLPIPKITVGEWLVRRLELVYGRDAFRTYCVGQIVDLDSYGPRSFSVCAALRSLFKRPLRVLIVGMFGASVKAIADASRAVALMRSAGVQIHLTRVSSLPLTAEEAAITPVQEYHHAVRPEAMADLYHAADLMLAPSLEQEGFGLPFAEALASGLPCVATAIPSFLSFDVQHDYAVFVPQHDPSAMAEAAVALLGRPEQLKTLRRRGPQVVQKFRGDNVARRLEQVFGEITA